MVEAARKEFRRCFVRTSTSIKLGLLSHGNWKLLVDFDQTNRLPLIIYATSQRPDIVVWSIRSRRVILIELTCCAEEGIRAAQIRKEVCVHELVENIRTLFELASNLASRHQASVKHFDCRC